MTPADRCAVCGLAVGRGRNGGRLLHTRTVVPEGLPPDPVSWPWFMPEPPMPTAVICEGSGHGARP